MSPAGDVEREREREREREDLREDLRRQREIREEYATGNTLSYMEITQAAFSHSLLIRSKSIFS